MFYSHEILTSRKYGVATIWLVATLGSKSAARKINKKAILEVNVRKAVQTIIAPEAPMALRLQSNLLYGVSRVYDQQCGYVLLDAQSFQAHMRALLKIVRSDELDPNAGKVKRGQLLLVDDPGFFPDFAMPPLDFDIPGFGALSESLSQLSPYGSQEQRSRSGSDISLPNLNILSSSNSSRYQLPMADPFQLSSAGKGPGSLGREFEDEPLLFDENLDFEIGADGEVRDRAESLILGHRVGSDSAASGRVRLEHEDGQAARVVIDLGDDFIPRYDDDDFRLPDAEAFPNRKRTKSQSSEQELSAESDFAEAPVRKKRRARIAKALHPDASTQLSKQELRDFISNYLGTMTTANQAKIKKGEHARAKQDAEWLVWGLGYGEIGAGQGQRGITGELAEMFSGDQLRMDIMGSIPVKRKRGRISAADAAAAEEQEQENDEARRVRARTGEDEYQIGRFQEEEGFRQEFGDESEIGRSAVNALEEHRSSVMPWNVSSSLRSHRTQSAAGARHSSVPAGRHSRITSASPLIGRGRLDPTTGEDLQEFERLDENDPIPFSSGGETDFGAAQKSSSQQADDFEVFGAAANVDTQTAATSQWVAEAMAKESLNFLDYIRNTINEEQNHDLEGDFMANPLTTVAFERLIPAQSSSAIVAAQAFYHVLTLATRGVLIVEQNSTDENPYGEIELSIKEDNF